MNAKKVKVKKTRVDELLVSRSIVGDLKAAQAMILAGDVFVRGDHRVASGAVKVAQDEPLRVRTNRGRGHPWVSRGGLKLAHALETWPDVAAACRTPGATAIDVGSSTGGFTDVLLANGVGRVYCVDVGRGILDWRLRTDTRVVLREQTNARDLDASALALRPGEMGEEEEEKGARAGAVADALGPQPAPTPAPPAQAVTLVVCDASFIKLSTVLPAALALCAPGASLVALVKPQFEARREEVEAGGVVRDPEVHARVCREAKAWLEGPQQPQPDTGGGGGGDGGGDERAAAGRWTCRGIEPSPITGPSGNVEFLLYGTKA